MTRTDVSDGSMAKRLREMLKGVMSEDEWASLLAEGTGQDPNADPDDVCQECNKEIEWFAKFSPPSRPGVVWRNRMIFGEIWACPCLGKVVVLND